MTLHCTCGRPTDTYLCTGCTDDHRQRLAELLWLLHQLDLVAGKRTRYSSQGTGHDQFPLPIRVDAITLRDRVRSYLATTVRLLADPTGATYPRDTLHAILTWLTAHQDVIPLRPEGPDIVAELHHLHTAIIDIIDRPPNTRYAGVCQCGLAIHAHPDATWHRCPCGEQHDIEALIAERTLRARDYLLTISEISNLSGIPRRTLRSWADRRQLDRAGTRDGQPAYRYGAALDLRQRQIERAEDEKRRLEKEARKTHIVRRVA